MVWRGKGFNVEGELRVWSKNCGKCQYGPLYNFPKSDVTLTSGSCFRNDGERSWTRFHRSEIPSKIGAPPPRNPLHMGPTSCTCWQKIQSHGGPSSSKNVETHDIIYRPTTVRVSTFGKKISFDLIYGINKNFNWKKFKGIVKKVTVSECEFFIWYFFSWLWVGVLLSDTEGGFSFLR